MSINDRPPVFDQPRVGQVILTCKHLGADKPGVPMKVFRINMPVPFTRPNGTKGEAKLLGVCVECFHATGGDMSKVVFCRDSTWQSRPTENTVRVSHENRDVGLEKT